MMLCNPNKRPEDKYPFDLSNYLVWPPDKQAEENTENHGCVPDRFKPTPNSLLDRQRRYQPAAENESTIVFDSPRRFRRGSEGYAIRPMTSEQRELLVSKMMTADDDIMNA